MKRYGLAIFLLLGIALLLSLPVLPLQSRYRSDEKFYADAAMTMVRTGDYVTPMYAHGALRFQKPGLNYWLIAGAYHLLGINQFSARLPQLLAGVALLWITFLLARDLFDCPSLAAALAAAMLMANIQFLNSSIRSTADIVQCLFVAMAQLGFVRVFFSQQRTFPNFLLLYAGAGLAVATKGAMGAMFLVFALGFAAVSWWRNHARPAPWKLLHPTAVALGAVLGGGWFVAVLAIHGRSAIAVFLGDQVGNRFDGDTSLAARVLDNLGAYVPAPLFEFLPWTALAIVAAIRFRHQLRPWYETHRVHCLFVAGWLLFLMLPLLPGNIQRTRYLLPAYPMLAALMASVFHHVDAHTDWMARWGKRVARAVSLAVALFGIGLALSTATILPAAATGGVALAATGLFAWRAGRFATGNGHLVLAAALLFSAYRLNDLLVRPVFYRPPAPALCELLDSINADERSLLFYDTLNVFPAQLRIASGGRFWPDLVPPQPVAGLTAYDVIVREPRGTPSPPPPGYVRLTLTTGNWYWKVKHYLALVTRSKSVDELFAETSLEFEIHTRKAPEEPAP